MFYKTPVANMRWELWWVGFIALCSGVQGYSPPCIDLTTKFCHIFCKESHKLSVADTHELLGEDVRAACRQLPVGTHTKERVTRFSASLFRSSSDWCKMTSAYRLPGHRTSVPRRRNSCAKYCAINLSKTCGVTKSWKLWILLS